MPIYISPGEQYEQLPFDMQETAKKYLFNKEFKSLKDIYANLSLDADHGVRQLFKDLHNFFPGNPDRIEDILAIITKTNIYVAVPGNGIIQKALVAEYKSNIFDCGEKLIRR